MRPYTIIFINGKENAQGIYLSPMKYVVKYHHHCLYVGICKFYEILMTGIGEYEVKYEVK